MKNYKELKIVTVKQEMFNDFGVVIKIPKEGEKEPTLKSSFFKHYAELGFINCKEPVEFGITTFNKRKLLVEKLEQHANTQELLYAINGDFIMPVAPIVYKGGEAFPEVGKIIAITVGKGEGVIFNDGVWHWAPYPSDKEKSSVLVGFKKGTCHNDIIIKDLPQKYMMIFK